jgi:hypothetical protein
MTLVFAPQNAEASTVRSTVSIVLALFSFLGQGSAWPDNPPSELSPKHDVSLLLNADSHAPPIAKPARLTIDGALEHNPAFKEAARKAWREADYGDLAQEAGFIVSRAGKMSAVRLGPEIHPSETVGYTAFNIPPDGVFATFHTHPRPSMTRKWIQGPSQVDIEVAKAFRQNVYVVSSVGLWLVEPDGTVLHLFANEDWMKPRT